MEVKAHKNNDPKSSIFNHPTISYKARIELQRSPDETKGNYSEIITHINVPMLEISSKLGGMGSFFSTSILQEKNVFLKTHTVEEWLWGYEQTDLKHISKGLQLLSDLNPLFETL